jgi:hypothetical protein
MENQKNGYGFAAISNRGRYLPPTHSMLFHVTEEDAKTLFPWFHLFGMTNLLEECDDQLSISSPKFLDDDLNNVNH